MRAESMNAGNCHLAATVLGMTVTWWRGSVWDDGFFQPPYLELRFKGGRGVVLRMGRYHKSGPYRPMPTEWRADTRWVRF